MDGNRLPDDDTLFIRAAQRESLLTDEQIAEGRELQQKMRDMGLKPKPISEILQERCYLIPEEASRLRETVEKVRHQFRIPGYKLLKRLGRGSMGTVYKARQLNLDRLVAIKVLASFLSENAAFVKRFLKEARVIGKLNHPNIVQGFDAGDVDGTYYFAMEYCSGPTLLTILERGGALDQDRAINIVSQVARALDHAVTQGLIHRDVKPDNIMIVQGGVAKLCDLGLAKDVSRGSGSTEKGATLGTPNYISPEQARGDAHVDIRSDLYSLGATLYHMVTGVPPFDGPNPTVIMVKHLNEPPLPPRVRSRDVDARLQPIIIKMLAKNPDDRYQTPSELLAQLDDLRGRRRAEAAGEPPPQQPVRPPVIRRRR
ncbi:MAG: serine/threonine protein kinase [Planctomycetes bacterium]|nr:serine/threonine protein kinase [Planctomycetota bacterium]